MFDRLETRDETKGSGSEIVGVKQAMSDARPISGFAAPIGASDGSTPVTSRKSHSRSSSRNAPSPVPMSSAAPPRRNDGRSFEASRLLLHNAPLRRCQSLPPHTQCQIVTESAGFAYTSCRHDTRSDRGCISSGNLRDANAKPLSLSKSMVDFAKMAASGRSADRALSFGPFEPLAFGVLKWGHMTGFIPCREQ